MGLISLAEANIRQEEEFFSQRNDFIHLCFFFFFFFKFWWSTLHSHEKRAKVKLKIKSKVLKQEISSDLSGPIAEDPPKDFGTAVFEAPFISIISIRISAFFIIFFSSFFFLFFSFHHFLLKKYCSAKGNDCLKALQLHESIHNYF